MRSEFNNPSPIKELEGDKITELSTLKREPKDSHSSNTGCLKILNWDKWEEERGYHIMVPSSFFMIEANSINYYTKNNLYII